MIDVIFQLGIFRRLSENAMISNLFDILLYQNYYSSLLGARIHLYRILNLELCSIGYNLHTIVTFPYFFHSPDSLFSNHHLFIAHVQRI